MAPELFPSVPGAVSGMQQHKEVEDRVTEKVRAARLARVHCGAHPRHVSLALATC